MDDAWERHSLFRCGAFGPAVIVHRSIFGNAPRTSGINCSRGDAQSGGFRDVGDPGNRITTKCLCEAALSILCAEDRLPGGSARGGVLTPATGLGNVLVERLRQAGMVIEPK